MSALDGQPADQFNVAYPSDRCIETPRGHTSPAKSQYPGRRYLRARQNPEPDSYFEFNWSMDEWTRGDFAGCMGPGVWTGSGFGPAVREPVGRVHWAGVDTATYSYHCVSRAAQSGERAAKEALAAD